MAYAMKGGVSRAIKDFFIFFLRGGVGVGLGLTSFVFLNFF